MAVIVAAKGGTTAGCVVPGCDYCDEVYCGPYRNGSSYTGTQTQPGPSVVANAKNVCCGRSCGDVKQTLKSISAWLHGAFGHDNCVEDRFTATADQLISGQFKCFEGCTTFALEFVALARELNIPCEIVETVSSDAYKHLRAGQWPCPFAGHAFAKCQDTNGKWFYYNPMASHFPRVIGNWLSASPGDLNNWYYIRAVIHDWVWLFCVAQFFSRCRSLDQPEVALAAW